MQTPPAITDVLVNDELLGFHLEDGRFISVPVAFYPTLALATAEERGRFEINGSSVYWPELDADIGVEGLLAGAREHHHLRAQSRGTRRPAGPATQDGLGKTSPATRLTVRGLHKRAVIRPESFSRRVKEKAG